MKFPTLFLLLVLLATTVAAPHHPLLPASSGDGCAWYDVMCHLTHFFEWLITQGFRTALKPFEPVVNYMLAQPLLRLGLAIPVFNASGPQPFVTRILSDAMEGVWTASLGVGYGILAAAFIVSIAWLAGEALDVVRSGEATLFMRRALVIAVLMPVSAKLYDCAAMLIAMINSYILPIHDFVQYCDSLAGTIITAAAGLSLFGGWTFLLGIFLTGFVLMTLGAMRLLLIAILAALLPVALALSVFPWQPVRRFGETMLSMLINLLLASIVCAALFRFGAILAQHYAGGDWVDTAMRIIVFFACALAPALSLILAPRASIGLYMTSMFLGYAFRPWIRTVAKEVYPTIRAGLTQIASYVESAATTSRVARVLRVPIAIYRATKHPGGLPGAAIARGIQAYRAWKASREHPEDSSG